MRDVEWRLFLPCVDIRRAPAEARTLIALVDHLAPRARTDVYLKAGADVGVKRRGDGGLEFKALKRRQVLGGGVGPGQAETFKKVKLGEDATPAHIVDHLREEAAGGGEGASGGVSGELEALMSSPVEVSVHKSVRKVDTSVGEGEVCLEFTEIAVSSRAMPEAYPKKWMTFCVEGSIDAVEAFLGGTGKPLVALLSHREALQVGYPQFVDMVSTS
ncbi:unnamed protein product [Scytosiphon promiscuus]